MPVDTATATAADVPPDALASLRGTRPWVLFLGVMSVIGAVLCGLYVLLALIGSLAALGLHAGGGGTGAAAMMGPMMAFGLVYGGLMLAVMILAAMWLLRYAGELQALGDAPEAAAQALERALVTQRRLWILLAVVAIAGMVLGIVFAGVFAAVAPHLPPVQDLRA